MKIAEQSSSQIFPIEISVCAKSGNLCDLRVFSENIGRGNMPVCDALIICLFAVPTVIPFVVGVSLVDGEFIVWQ